MDLVFLFPGQGSQEIGMGQDLFKDDTHFKSLISLASDITHEDLEKLCLRGPEKRLRKAHYLQPLLAAVSLGYYNRVKQAGLFPSLVLGHSLGEITSLAASGVVSDEDAVAIAAKRGELMDIAASQCDGGMLAVLFVELDTVRSLLAEIGRSDRIVLANDNAPNQIVVSGDTVLLARFSAMVSERGLGKCKSIMVSGPWHSPFMAFAHEQFRTWVETISFRAPRFPLMLNATAQCETDPQAIRTLITNQLISPVYWRACMNAVRAKHTDAFLEIGPQRVLSGLIRVNGFPKDTVIYNVNNLVGCQRAADALSPPL